MFEVNNETILLREKFNGRKIYFTDILPTEQLIMARLSTYTSSDVDLSKYNGKLYEDPLYSKEVSFFLGSYMVLNGDWVIDEETDEIDNVILKFTDNKSGQFIKLALPNHINKFKFLNELNVNVPINKKNINISESDIVNKNVMYPNKINTIKAGLSLLSVGIGTLLIFNGIKNYGKRMLARI